ncbi:MAG: hypothetical protein MI922_10780, partial [Bacteroidales bacterium]|nr:hypothetical protein [Bacteroidales bacterium]
KLPKHPDLLHDYITYYSSSSTTMDISESWQWYWCGIGNLTEVDYKNAYADLEKKLEKRMITLPGEIADTLKDAVND